jgi:hypothetical protein
MKLLIAHREPGALKTQIWAGNGFKAQNLCIKGCVAYSIGHIERDMMNLCKRHGDPSFFGGFTELDLPSQIYRAK